ncbi:cytochrome c-type biogenesis protein CcsB [Chryseobacterium piscicola]|uniref:Cytochrome C biogenesis protein CcsB n=1 Tax=Chryseobacterium piscicola TaxID=551459 RepID=A0A1N7LW29_9FLAO|nr:cytochrome c biogenesis protein CcsA [Chryseobacterium piscicola]PQA92512.1 cytochrome C biogenesis protein CcsB [Chryseobacterium piscicola]SIS78033.1 cytochrome c-type biogenesis protein CcsB [Chryseobacterium piscicola]
MKKLTDLLISTRTTAVLLLVYAFSMAYATFMENDYGTPTAKALIYEAKWFELVMFLLILNFCGNIARYRLWKREKWPVLVFHLAFILIFIGGAVTRYISFEGQMSIREGETTNEIVTDKHFFKIQIEEKGDVLTYQDIPYLMSPLHKSFEANYEFHNKKIKVVAKEYIQRKKDSLVPNTQGAEYLHLVSTGSTGRQNIYLKQGETKSINGTLVSFGRAIEGAVEFANNNGQLMIKTPVDAAYMTMATQATGNTVKNQFQPLVLRSLYTINELKLVVPEGLKKGKLMAIEGDKKKDQNVPDQLTVEIQGPKTKQLVDLSVERGNPDAYKQVTMDGLNIMLGFGPKKYTTPFSIKLDDFVMETYPGSTSPSAYESHIKVIDEGKETPHKIYMNNVLNYKGYRFFQASYTPDRMGTLLSVNHDFWGTLISYIGYAFLFGGMFVMFFWKGTHFWKLNKMLKDISKKKATMILLILLSLGLNAQKIETHGTSDGSREHVHVEGDDHSHDVAPELVQPKQNSVASPLTKMRNISPDEIISKNKISKEHADKFGYLLVQNFEGRIVPINTEALDVLRKLYQRDKFKGTDGKFLTAEQWFISINTDTPSWTMVPLIKVDAKGGKELLKMTKANEDGYTSLMNLFPADANGNLTYILEAEYNTAFRKKPAEQSEYDKQIIKINERVQIFNGLFSGQFMRIVPVKNDPNHTWNSWLNQKMEPDTESQQVMGPYFAEVLLAQKTGNWSKADAELKKLSDYQQKWGKSVVPTQSKVDLEVFMNKTDINFKLLIFYTLIGGLLLILGFVELFKPNKILNKIIKGFIYLGLIGYFCHFLGLIGRWYISGHAPWSNGYEAIIFISWVGISAGLMFYFGFGKSSFTDKTKSEGAKNLVSKNNSNALIPAAGYMVAVIMMGFAHGASSLDPQITPLVPVLKSYWLIVHVAIIISSYGFFSLSMIIAVISLVFYIISDKKLFKTHNDSTLKELAIVAEMSTTIGLFALTVGMFLGGIWANESWGRYWSWDPKETWAFISVIIYAFVLHMRLVPGLRSRWAIHVATMFSFCSMLMTYVGVNYYLSGLHSYAAGDPVPIPAWVYIGFATMVVLSVVSFIKFKALTKK